MNFKILRKTAFFSLLITLLFTLMPVDGFAMPQQSDITKPTRERVKNNTDKKKQSTDKNKSDNKAEAGKKDDKSAAAAAAVTKKDNKQQTTTAPKSGDTKDNKAVVPAVKQDDKQGNKQDEKVAPEQPAKVQAPPVVDKNYNGIDVSKHQGVINWDVVKKDPKIQYVYIKATEGSDLVDERYKQNLHNARKAGFKVGSYHYLTNKSSVVNQFKNFASTAIREEQDLLPVIDVEVRKQWTAQQLRDSLKVFAKMVEDYYGCKPIIYTYESFFRNNLGKAFADYPIFIAKYSRTEDQPNINGVKWILWQYSESGRVNGITGRVDLSRFNKGHSLNDILYRPSKSKPKLSVKDAVDRNKPKPTTATLMEQPQTKEEKARVEKQREEDAKKAAKQKKVEERQKKLAEEEAKAKEEKAKADKEKADRAKAAKARAEKEKADKAKAEKEKAERAEKARAERQKAEKAKAEKEKAAAEAKAKRKAEAQKARQEAAKKSNKTNKSNKAASMSSKMTQSQRNDSIRAAQQRGRKINKSSADND